MLHSRRGLAALLIVVAVLGITSLVVRSARSLGGRDSTAPAAAPVSPAADNASPFASAPDGQPAAAAPAARAPVAQAVPSPAPSLTLLGQTDLGGRGFNGDVAVHNGFAYVGSWGSVGACPALGVRIVDLADPANPHVVATAARIAGSSAEDTVALRVDTPSFSGDLLAVGIQSCGGAQGGLALVDITDPRNPADLGFFVTGSGARGVHELDVTVRDGRVLALLAVPYSEGRGRDGDFRIVDITDPRRPAQISSWGIRAELGISDGAGCTASVYDHSARASADGTRAYLSYWDAGVVILDISDPAAPRYLGRAFEPDVEGAIHSVDELPNGMLLVAEEDDVFRSPRGLRLRVEANGETFEARACEGDSNRELDDAGVLGTSLTYLGGLCAGTGVDLAGGVALVEAAGCSLGGKARRARAAGASAMIVIGQGRLATPDSGESALFPLPVVAVSAESGARLRALADTGAASVVLPAARLWGGLRVWDIRDPAHPVRRALFRTAHAEQFPPPGPGYYTIHNPLAAGRYALLSWYADGVRLVDLADPDHPREIAAFVPPATPDPFHVFPPDAEVWGVALAGDLVVASDVNAGLYVLRAVLP